MRLLTMAPLLLALAPIRGIPDPPPHARWELTFRDEFDGTALNWDTWVSEAGPRGPTQLEGRWPENNVVKGGLLHQVTRRENPPRGGKAWSTGSIWTKSFAQQYGYFECRMRYGKYLNNAFWLYRSQSARFPDRPFFEIDVNEGHTPSQVAMTFHYYLFPDDQPEGELRSFAKCWDAAVPLDGGFHLYGCEWNEKLIIWTFDG
jgi:beta-glucanase (GH16 family)